MKWHSVDGCLSLISGFFCWRICDFCGGYGAELRQLGSEGLAGGVEGLVGFLSTLDRGGMLEIDTE